MGGGANYQFAVTHSDNVSVDLATISNADVTVTGPNGYAEFAQLVSADLNADGGVDAIYQVSPNGGTWDASDNGTYQIMTVTGEVADLGGNEELGGVVIGSFAVNITTGIPNDLDGDGDVDADDIDTLCLAILDGSTNALFDIDGSGTIDSSDFDAYLDLIGVLPGDANIDGVVDVTDFNIWNSNKFTFNDPSAPGVGWATADFNCDGVSDVTDFNTWNSNKFTSVVPPGIVPNNSQDPEFAAARTSSTSQPLVMPASSDAVMSDWLPAAMVTVNSEASARVPNGPRHPSDGTRDIAADKVHRARFASIDELMEEIFAG